MRSKSLCAGDHKKIDPVLFLAVLWEPLKSYFSFHHQLTDNWDMGWSLSRLIKIWNCFPDNYLCVAHSILEPGKVPCSYKACIDCRFVVYSLIFLFFFHGMLQNWDDKLFFLFLLSCIILEPCGVRCLLSQMQGNAYKEGVVRKSSIPVFKYDSINRSVPDALLWASESRQRPRSYTFCCLIRKKHWVEKWHWEGWWCKGRGLPKRVMIFHINM